MKKVLSFDIGGTNTRLALINDEYEIEKELILPTELGDIDAFLASIKNIILQLDCNLKEVEAIGIGVPGVADRSTGYIYDLPNVHIKDVPLGAYLKDSFGIPVYMRNDAEVACLGEAVLGAGKDYSRVFFVTISTGLGGALAVDRLNQDYITEIGHTAYRYKGKWTEYEVIASGSGIIKLAAMNGLTIKNAGELFAKANEGDELAKSVYEDWLKILSDFLSMIQTSYQPEIIVVTGGVMKSKDFFFSELIKRNPLSNIVECHFGQEAGLIGAAAYALLSHKSK